MKVLAISGWKGSGKDTLAAYLGEKYSAQRVSFADPLKDSVADEFGIERSSLDDPSRKEKPILHMPVAPKDAYSRMIVEFLIKEMRSAQGVQPVGFRYVDGEFYGLISSDSGTVPVRVYWTPRALAILKGSTNRSVDSSFWVKQAVNKIQNLGEMLGIKMFVISDLRYKSELSQLKSQFGDNLVSIRVERFDTSPSSDPSERDLDDAQFDYRINNRESKEKAFAQLEEIVSKL